MMIVKWFSFFLFFVDKIIVVFRDVDLFKSYFICLEKIFFEKNNIYIILCVFCMDDIC